MKAFIDTNVLVYSIDPSDPEKTDVVRGLLRDLADSNRGIISTQVMQEFYVVATKKLGVDALTAKSFLDALQSFEITTIDPVAIYRAIDISILNQISFWDALILAAAEKMNCGKLYTEDLNHGQTINGIEIIDPFK